MKPRAPPHAERTEVGTPVCSRAIEIGVAAVCARAPPTMRRAAILRSGAGGDDASIGG